MKILLVLRGIPGCGKSTWVKDMGFSQYTLSTDDIRLLFAGPELGVDGNYHTSARFDKQVWNFLYEKIEFRMKNGEFIVVDATHTLESYLKDYKKMCKTYNYRMIVVDFSKVDLDTCKIRNRQREDYKVVPEAALDKMYARLQNPLQGSYEIYPFEEVTEAFLDSLLYKVDGDKYKKVVIFGDIHSCYDPLKEYFDNNPIVNDNLYVFVGDYFDRGHQSREVLQFCLDNCEKNNFIFLTGNHELWLKNYVKDGMEGRMTPAFKESLDQMGDLTDKLSIFAKRLKICVNIEMHTVSKLAIDNTVFTNKVVFVVTHGGVSNRVRYNTSTMQCIKGVGDYEEEQEVIESFNTHVNTLGSSIEYYNVHGHRNIDNRDIVDHDNHNINLEGKVEFGGNLRILELYKQDLTQELIFNPIEIRNNYYDGKMINYHNERFVKDLDINDLVRKKELGDDVVSYNFDREAFYSKKWNKLTTTARGLFVDTFSKDVVARSYNKFFNLEEHGSTEWRNLEANLKFPVKAYLKENGFLGIVSVRNDKLFIASKSTNQGPFKEILEKIIYATVDTDALKTYLKENNCSAIFECIDPINDPHIIEYADAHVVLLDIVENNFDSKFKSYDEVKLLADKIKCNCKKLYMTIDNFEALKLFIETFDKTKEDEIEGFVFVDQSGFMFKYKTPFYRFWKQMRSIKEKIDTGKYDILNHESIETETDRIIMFMKHLYLDLGSEEFSKLNIIQIRNLFMKVNEIENM